MVRSRLGQGSTAIEYANSLAWIQANWPWLADAAALLAAYLLGRVGRRSGTELAGPEAGALAERLHSMGRQQEVVGQALAELQGILGNKQARGEFGEVQLERLVADLMPARAYKFQAVLGRNRVDCLIRMPWPPGPVPVDAKFPLEAYQAWLAAVGDPRAAGQALKQFQRDVALHVEAIRSKYIVAGQTADFALMFLPSEAVFAALHAQCPGAVESAHRARVFPVSPSTLWPLLNTLAAALRDAQFSADGAALQAHGRKLTEDSMALADHARRVERDWSRLQGDLQGLIAAADALAIGGRAFGVLGSNSEDMGKDTADRA